MYYSNVIIIIVWQNHLSVCDISRIHNHIFIFIVILHYMLRILVATVVQNN